MSLQKACYALVDGFTDMTSSDSKRREVYMELVASILSFIIAVAVLAFIGKWLWNYVVVDLFTFAKPVRSVWQIIGLMLFINLIR
jgi:hypothetical protein